MRLSPVGASRSWPSRGLLAACARWGPTTSAAGGARGSCRRRRGRAPRRGPARRAAARSGASVDELPPLGAGELSTRPGGRRSATAARCADPGRARREQGPAIAAYRVEQYNGQLQVRRRQGGPQAIAYAQRTRDAVSQNRFTRWSPAPIRSATPTRSAAPSPGSSISGAGCAVPTRRRSPAARERGDRRALVLTLVSTSPRSTCAARPDRDLELLGARLAAARIGGAAGEEIQGGGINELPYSRRGRVREGRPRSR